MPVHISSHMYLGRSFSLNNVNFVNRVLFQAVLPCRLWLGIFKKAHLFFWTSLCPWHCLRTWISHASNFSQPSISATMISRQIGGALNGLFLQKPENIQPLLRTESVLQMVLQIVSHNVFSHLPRCREHFAESNSIPWNQPTIVHPSQIATVRQMFLHSELCSFSNAIRLGSMRCGSKMIPWWILLPRRHRSCRLQIQRAQGRNITEIKTLGNPLLEKID